MLLHKCYHRLSQRHMRNRVLRQRSIIGSGVVTSSYIPDEKRAQSPFKNDTHQYFLNQVEYWGNQDFHMVKVAHLDHFGKLFLHNERDGVLQGGRRYSSSSLAITDNTSSCVAYFLVGMTVSSAFAVYNSISLLH